MEPQSPAESRGKLYLEGTPSADGGSFELLSVQPSGPDERQFPPETLIATVPLLDQVECFLSADSAANNGGHRPAGLLTGLLSGPVWDETLRRIRCSFVPGGAGSALLQEWNRQLFSAGGSQPTLRFAAGLSYRQEDGQVPEIMRIYTADTQVDPAGRGALLQAQNNLRTRERETQLIAQLQTDRKAMESLRESQEQLNGMAEETAKVRRLRAEMCRQLLDTALLSAQLPPAVAVRVRRQFSNRVFEPSELMDAIEDHRKLVSELIAGEPGESGGRIHAMYSSEDQISAAVHDLLRAQRPSGLAGLQPRRLSGIRELYTLMTGDYDFHGGYDPARAHFSLSADLPAILKNTLNKLVAQRWEELGANGYRWWEPVVTVEHFNNLQPISGILVGEISLLPSVAEGGSYVELGVKDSAETGAWSKYGGYLGLTIEMFERDDTLRLRQFPVKLATAGLRRLSALVAAVFLANEGKGPAMADGTPVFDAAKHHNLGMEALSGASWEAANQAVFDQPMLVAGAGDSPKLAIDARYLLVPRRLRLTAQRILYPALAWDAEYHAENLQRGLPGDVITCPEFTGADDWAAVADPALAPAIFVGERFGLMPEIYVADNQLSGALFTHDEVRIKARHFLSVFVTDHRPLFKANVAAG